MKKTTRSSSEKPWWRSFPVCAIAVIATFILITIIFAPHISKTIQAASGDNLLLRTALLSNKGYTYTSSNATVEAEQLAALVHYATTRAIPQQTREEIAISFAELRRKGPANFLVYGLGIDSQMWAAINPGGYTLFLEEDEVWYKNAMEKAPYLNAYAVKYRTMLKESPELLKEYEAEPDCWPSKAYLRGNDRCRLALHNLPNVVYEKEWDLIMIDAPKGYFPEAPGRMAAIFSAAVMARDRKGDGPTHVFLHDVDRPVEEEFAMTFLCNKNLVGAAGRLWHFAIPPAQPGADGNKFC